MSIKVLKIQFYGNSSLFGNLIKELYVYNFVVDVVSTDDLAGWQFSLVHAVRQDEGIYANQIVTQFRIIGQRICEFKDFGRFCNFIYIIVVYGSAKKIRYHFGCCIYLSFGYCPSFHGVCVEGNKKIYGFVIVRDCIPVYLMLAFFSQITFVISDRYIFRFSSVSQHIQAYSSKYLLLSVALFIT